MNLLLRLKTRELFLLFIALLLLQGFFLELSDVLQIITIAICMLWVYQVGLNMRGIIPQNIRPGIAYFNFSFLFVIAFIVGFGMFESYLFRHGAYQSLGYLDWAMTAVVFYAQWSLLYVIGFSVRILESAIEGEMIGILGSKKAFICLLIFPVGVWHMQPAAQRVMAKYKA